jgi:hypothetical protein
VRVLALLLLALSLAACESTQEESAQLEREAKEHPAVVAQRGLSIAQVSRDVQVLATKLVGDAEGSAALVTLLDTSPHPLHEIPIAITVRSTSGQVLYQNNTPGLAASLVSVPLLEPGQDFTWIDDQVPATGAGAGSSSAAGESGARVQAVVGEAPSVAQASASLPQMEISGIHTIEDPTQGEGTAGTVRNTSGIPQDNLVVYGIARRGGRVVAAARAELANVPAGGSAPFEMFFIGEPKGAKLELNAPASTLG